MKTITLSNEIFNQRSNNQTKTEPTDLDRHDFDCVIKLLLRDLQQLRHREAWRRHLKGVNILLDNFVLIVCNLQCRIKGAPLWIFPPLFKKGTRPQVSLILPW